VLASSQDNPDQSDARVLRIVLSLITFLNKAVHSHTAMLVGLTPPPPSPPFCGRAILIGHYFEVTHTKAMVCPNSPATPTQTYPSSERQWIVPMQNQTSLWGTSSTAGVDSAVPCLLAALRGIASICYYEISNSSTASLSQPGAERCS